MPRKRDRFRVGDYWLDCRPNSPNWCQCWLDRQARPRQTRRASLGTDDLEQAKLMLLAWIQTNTTMTKEAPGSVALATCLARYYQNQAQALRSADQARRALIR